MMNKYILDTNILVYLVHNKDFIHKDVFSLLSDLKAQLYTNSICIGEFVHLSKLGKIKKTKDVYHLIESMNIKVIPMSKEDFDVYENLNVSGDSNKDPNDHQIIAQAISRNYYLVSSDGKFPHYEKEGLKFIFNKK